MSQQRSISPARKVAVLGAVLASMGSLPVALRGYTIPRRYTRREGSRTGTRCPKCGSRHVYVKTAGSRCLNCQHRW